MAVPPNVPTSFVPRQSFSSSTIGRGFDFGGAFAFLCYGILLFAIVAAGGVFLYGRILDSSLASKNAELNKVQTQVDEATVTSLIRLSDRIAATKDLLNNHVALSGLLDLLEKTTLVNVRTTSLEVGITDAHLANVSIAGSAKNFNALAAESAAIGADARLKNAIFSGIKLEQGGGVSYVLSAVLDPKLIQFVPGHTVQNAAPAVVATSSPKKP